MSDDEIRTKAEALAAIDEVIEKLTDTCRAQRALAQARRIRKWISIDGDTE